MQSIMGWLAMPVLRVYVERDAVGQIPILLEHASIEIDPDEKYWSRLWRLDYRGVIWLGQSFIRVYAKPIDDNCEVVSFGLPPVWRPLACLRSIVVTRRAARALRAIERDRLCNSA